MNKILILKSNRDAFERYFIEHMQTKNCVTKPYYKNITWNKYVRALAILWMEKFKLPLQSIWYGDWKCNLEEYDTIVVFDRYWGDGIFKYIHKRNPSARIICWYWNSLIHQNVLQSKYRKFCECWSFDQSDVEKYNLKYNNMFYFLPNKRKIECNLDSFFVGADKGRTLLLREIAGQLQRLGLRNKFIVISQNCDDTDLLLTYQKSNFDYNEYVKILEDSRCVVEVLQEGQRGVTIRAIEALMHEKKLITTNEDIVNYDFYNKDNIFVWGKDSIEELQDFFMRPYRKIDKSIRGKYTFEQWLNNFMEE